MRLAQQLAIKSIYVVVTLILGAFAGAFTWAFFFLMNKGIHFIWDVLPAQFDVGWYVLAVCVAGGIIVGLFTKFFGAYPQSMDQVMGEVKQTGRYEYKSIGKSFFGALLPLLFGGSLGPEAGLTGVIAGLCTWVGDRLRFLGKEYQDLSSIGISAVVSATFSAPLFGLAVPIAGTTGARDTQEPPASDASEKKQAQNVCDSVGNTGLSADTQQQPPSYPAHLDVPKATKFAVYLCAIAGALGAMTLLGNLFGTSGGLPRFEGFAFGVKELWLLIPLALVGTLAGFLFHASGALARRISKALGDRHVLKAVIAGAALGVCGTFLPYTMFAGETQTEVLQESWMVMGAFVLLATGFLKVVVTQLCLHLGWRGGKFFPCIFAGVSIGFAFAGLTGADPVFCTCACTAALMGSMMRQPLMASLLLFLCFPVKAVIVMFFAASIGAAIPVPRTWLDANE